MSLLLLLHYSAVQCVAKNSPFKFVLLFSEQLLEIFGVKFAHALSVCAEKYSLQNFAATFCASA